MQSRHRNNNANQLEQINMKTFYVIYLIPGVSASKDSSVKVCKCPPHPPTTSKPTL